MAIKHQHYKFNMGRFSFLNHHRAVPSHQQPLQNAAVNLSTSPGILSSSLLHIYFPAVPITQGLSSKQMFLVLVLGRFFSFLVEVVLFRFVSKPLRVGLE